MKVYFVEFRNYAGSEWLNLITAESEEDAINKTIEKNRKFGSGTAKILCEHSLPMPIESCKEDLANE